MSSDPPAAPAPLPVPTPSATAPPQQQSVSSFTSDASTLTALAGIGTRRKRARRGRRSKVASSSELPEDGTRAQLYKTFLEYFGDGAPTSVVSAGSSENYAGLGSSSSSSSSAAAAAAAPTASAVSAHLMNSNNDDDDDDDDDEFTAVEDAGDELDYDDDVLSLVPKTVPERELVSLIQSSAIDLQQTTATTATATAHLPPPPPPIPPTTAINANTSANGIAGYGSQTLPFKSMQLSSLQTSLPSLLLPPDFRMTTVTAQYPQGHPLQYQQQQIQMHEKPKPLFTDDQLGELKLQLLKHMQLLVQVITILVEEQRGGDENREKIKQLCKMLDDLYKCFKVSHDYKNVFFFCITGQAPAVHGNVPTLFDIPQIEFAPRLVQYLLSEARVSQDDVYALSNPLCLSFVSELRFCPASAPQKSVWLPSEDMLLLTGLEEYGRDWDTIRDKLLPTRTKEQISVHFKNKSSRRAVDNPIKQFALEPGLTDSEKMIVMQAAKDYNEQWDVISAQLLPHRSPMTLKRFYQGVKMNVIKRVFESMTASNAAASKKKTVQQQSQQQQQRQPQALQANGIGCTRASQKIRSNAQSQSSLTGSQLQSSVLPLGYRQQHQSKDTEKDEESAAAALVSIPRTMHAEVLQQQQRQLLQRQQQQEQARLNATKIGIDGVPEMEEDIISSDED